MESPTHPQRPSCSLTGGYSLNSVARDDEVRPQATRSRWRWALLAGCVAVVIAGAAVGSAVVLSHSPSTHTAAPPVGSGYLATTRDDYVFIQWQVTGDAVTGTAHEVRVTGTPPNSSTTTSTLTVSGKIQGSSISLSFNGGARHFGTFSGSSFTIDVPVPSGRLAALTFRQSTAAHYNQVLSALQAKLANINAQATARLTRSNDEAAIDNAATAVRHDLQVLTSDEATITSAMSPMTNDLAKEHSDLLVVQSLAATAQHHPTNTSCQPATTAERSATTVEDDANAIGTVSDAVSSAISTVRGDITTLRADFAKLQTAEAVMPTFGTDLPTQAEVTAAVNNAQQLIAAAISHTNSVIGQANAYDDTAWHSANTALEAQGCGGAPTPAQITTIT